MRRVFVIVALLAGLAGVATFQLTQRHVANADARVFVPSSRFYLDFSPSFRTTIADAYWLSTVQYYGEHLKSDARFDSLGAMLDLVTELSPRFVRAYQFGAYALLDAGEGQKAYGLLQRGWRRNSDAWQLAAAAGMLVYMYGEGETKVQIAADWYRQAAAVAGSPDYVSRLAATLLQKGGERDKAITMWAQVYAEGDEYARQKAVTALDELLPARRDERIAALAALDVPMTPDRRAELSAALLRD